jgi:hypothetical protein
LKTRIAIFIEATALEGSKALDGHCLVTPFFSGKSVLAWLLRFLQKA